MLALTLRRGAALLAVLLACAPTKEDSGGDTGSGATDAATLGHSSAPTGGDPETTPTSGVSGPPDPSTATTTTTGEPQPTTVTTLTTTTTTAPDDATASDSDGADEGDGVPFSPVETTLAFIVTPPDLPPGECDPWAEDCPAGQKCMPFATPGSPTWDAVKCVPFAADAGAPGDPCSVFDAPTSGVDSCGLHAMCWDVDDELHGTCAAMCVGDGFNAAVCGPGDVCVQANDNVLLVCLPACEPLLADCPKDQVCAPAGVEFACVPDASGAGGQAFAPCAVGNGCDPGLVCGQSSRTSLCAVDSAECCLPFCDLQGRDTCPPGTICTSYGFADVGVCADP